MTRAISFLWGVLLALVGVGVLAWIAYNLLVETLPAAQGRNPYFPALLALSAVWAGVQRIRRGLRARDAD